MQGDLFGGAFEKEAPKAKEKSGPKAAAPKKPSPNGNPKEPADASQREAAVTCFVHPIMLEAGAGTGKTATLVARIVCWCVGTGWDASAEDAPKETLEEQAAAILASIAAITFTEAAAAEMSTRVSEALAQLVHASADKQSVDAAALPTGLAALHLPESCELLHARAQALRGSLEHLNISTIHSFCRRILASNPLEVGLAPGFEVDANGRGQRSAVRSAMENYLAKAWQDPIDPDLLTLARERFGAPEIEETVLDLLAKGARSADFETDPFDAQTVASLLSNLEAGAKELAGYLGGVFSSLPASQKVHDLLETLGELLSITSLNAETQETSQSPAERLQGISLEIHAAWSERASSKLEDYRKGKLLKGEEKLLEGDSQELFECIQRFEQVAAPFRSLHPALLNSGRRIVLSVLSEVERELRTQGVATFNDLLDDAQRLLTEHPEIAATERRRIGMLMVDEFQDTDQKQCDMVRVLALEGEAAERPNLFIVGDPKQSIFSWRNADLAAYDQFKESIEEAGGQVLQLTCNFRSTPTVLAEVTRVMQDIMQAEAGVQPPYVPLEAFRDDLASNPENPPIEHWLSWPEDYDTGGIQVDLGRSKSASYRTEAQAIATDIFARHVEQGADWQDFALIMRSMTQLDVYLAELRKRGIPFEVQSDRSYYRRREIIDASALVRAALDPGDILALVTLLRSPMVGLPDAALLPLWARGFPGQLADLVGPDQARLERLESDLSEVAALLPDSLPGIENIRGWEIGVMAALQSLAQARATFDGSIEQGSISVDAWIDQLRALFLPDATEAARYLGAHRLANLERFFDDLLERFEESGGDKQAVLRVLRSNIQRNERVDARPPGEGASDTVKILTIHGSKGLEYSSVYLPQLHKSDESGGNPFSSTSFDRRAGLVSYELFRSSTPNRSQTEALRKRTERAERVRLFYVAMTRAKNRLVMLSAWSNAGQAKTWDQAGSYAELLAQRPGVKEPLQALALQAAGRDASVQIDASGAAWRMSALIAAGSEVQAAWGEPVELPTLSLTQAKLERLAQLRQAAKAYSARPYGSQASGHATFEDESYASQNFSEECMGEFDQQEALAAGALDRKSAMRVGTEVHRILEHFTNESDLDALITAAAEDLPQNFNAAERQVFGDILKGMAQHGVFERLAKLEAHIIARELPALSPPRSTQEGASAFVSSAVDLLYRDPESGELVVVDYKTDLIQDEDQLQQRAKFYRNQGLTYAQAVGDALQLGKLPRLEFWFLRCGRVASLQG